MDPTPDEIAKGQAAYEQVAYEHSLAIWLHYYGVLSRQEAKIARRASSLKFLREMARQVARIAVREAIVKLAHDEQIPTTE